MAIAGVIAIAARLAALIPAVVTKAFVEVEIAIFHEICDFIWLDAWGTDFHLTITHHLDGEVGDQVDTLTVLKNRCFENEQ